MYVPLLVGYVYYYIMLVHLHVCILLVPLVCTIILIKYYLLSIFIANNFHSYLADGSKNFEKMSVNPKFHINF